MRLLYVFPHPDDESFGPAAVMNQQLNQGHEVFLLTLTRGGATRQRHRLGLSIEAMGEVRYNEILQVQQALGLSGLTVLNLPDGGLMDINPEELAETIRRHIQEIRPNVVITYPIHGISGHPDHIVTHKVVENVYTKLKEQGETYLRRLAYHTISEIIDYGNGRQLQCSPPESIDCSIKMNSDDIEVMKRALDCYTTYQEVIEKSGIRDFYDNRLADFEIYGEDHKPPLGDLTSFI
jgi:LmbE family N-acetylglucosaminyl deacetylase